MRRFKHLSEGGAYHAKTPLDGAKKAFTQLVKSGLYRQVFKIRELDIDNPKPLMYIGQRVELEFPRTRIIDGKEVIYKYKDTVRRLFKGHYVSSTPPPPPQLGP